MRYALTQSPLFLISKLIASRSETNPFVCLSVNDIRGGLVNDQFGFPVKRAVITFNAGIIGYDCSVVRISLILAWSVSAVVESSFHAL